MIQIPDRPRHADRGLLTTPASFHNDGWMFQNTPIGTAFLQAYSPTTPARSTSATRAARRSTASASTSAPRRQPGGQDYYAINSQFVRP
ncbi:MAG: hypothetical protein R2939_08855 [Kofleriaceae bacterium]